ncbi:restriction endonuclease subunit S [Pseudogemmobacter faecipullorum]|uniref:Restriction endonuclease subunit S n=1 Tax=Pseudogemmobacter faecipullorum TaxID=2755041 RepID=A0ABS8CTW4_9RHOB|nr:restriction endonuclease subunit S [Pseudogemmobacter faecipullorum]MCB5412265.1 restriction endonuclease subunit S [Pseudogemmobacter faecipullorum]
MSWSMVKLNEIADLVRGVTFSKDDTTDDANDTIPILRAGNIQDTLILSSDLVYLPPEFVSAKQLLLSGDIVMCMSSGSANILGKSGLLQMPWHGSFGAFLAVIRAVPEKADASYLSHFFRHPLFRSWASNSNGIGIKNIRLSDLADIEIPLPPLEEQKRIAGILDQADALRRLRARALEKLNTLGQAVFQEMFGDLRLNTKDWETHSIADICSEMVDCVNRTAPVVEEKTPFRMIRTTNVRHGKVNLDVTRYVNEETFERWNRRLVPLPGDVILTREAPVGEVGILQESGVFLGQRLFLYRPDTSRITSAFLCFQMQTDYLKNQFNQSGSGSTVKHISLPACQAFEIRVPPLNLQKEFEQRVRTASSLEQDAAYSLTKSEALFASLQSAAFQGKL